MKVTLLIEVMKVVLSTFDFEALKGRMLSLLPGLRAEIEGLGEDALWALADRLQDLFEGQSLPDVGWYADIRGRLQMSKYKVDQRHRSRSGYGGGSECRLFLYIAC